MNVQHRHSYRRSQRQQGHQKTTRQQHLIEQTTKPTPSINLLSFLQDYPDLKNYIFSFFCPYSYDDNKFILRQLSRSFYHLPLYNTLVVDKQSKSFLIKFCKTNKITKLKIRNHNRHLYEIPRSLLSSVRKIIIDDLNTVHLHIFLNLFSRFHIENIKINYCTCILPKTLLRFMSLKKLDIHITSKENEDLVFDLLILNENTLKKLKIGIYTGRNIDETKVQDIIEDNLKLEYISIRGDLLRYNMIKPCTKFIYHSFSYISDHVQQLQYLQTVRLEKVNNHDLEVIFKNLLVVESLSLWGSLSNYDHADHIEGHPYEYVLVDYDDLDLTIPYDGTIANISVTSTRLTRVFMHGFTIHDFILTNPYSIEFMSLEDVYFMTPIYLPKLKELHVENMLMNPENFKIDMFKVPKITDISLLHCIINNLFVFNSLKLLNIQHSIISVDMIHLLSRHKNLKHVLFFYDSWSYPQFDKRNLIKYLESKKIEFHDHKEW